MTLYFRNKGGKLYIKVSITDLSIYTYVYNFAPFGTYILLWCY